MKTRPLLAIALLLTTAACEETNPYSKLKIEGTWLLQTINDAPVATSSRMVLSLNDDAKCETALRYENDNDTLWAINGLKWDFHGTVLEISGTDSQGNVWSQNNTFLTVDDNYLRFVMQGAGSDIALNKESTSANGYNCLFKRLGTDKNEYAGTWECIEGNALAGNNLRIILDGDGGMTAQTMENGEWIDVAGLQATYWTYSCFLAVNYTKDGKRICSVWDYDFAVSGQDILWLWTDTESDSYHSMTFKKINR